MYCYIRIYRRVDVEREGMRFYWRLAVAASWIGINLYLELDLDKLAQYTFDTRLFFSSINLCVAFSRDNGFSGIYNLQSSCIKDETSSKGAI